MSFYDFQVRIGATELPPNQQPVRTRREAAAKHSDKEWEVQKPRIKRLYIDEQRPLYSEDKSGVSVAQKMQELYNFSATKRQYKRKTEKWNLRKYIRSHEMEAIIAADSLSSPSNSISVEPRKVQRFIRRQQLCVGLKKNHGQESESVLEEGLSKSQTACVSAIPRSSIIRSPRPAIASGGESYSRHLSLAPGSSHGTSVSPHTNHGALREREFDSLLSLSKSRFKSINTSHHPGLWNLESPVLDSPDVPTEQDWCALFVAQVLHNILLKVPMSSIFKTRLNHRTTPAKELIMLIDSTRLCFKVIDPPQDAALFAATLFCRFYDVQFSLVLTFSYKPHELLVTTLMLANKAFYSVPYNLSLLELAFDISSERFFCLLGQCLALDQDLFREPQKRWGAAMTELNIHISHMKSLCQLCWPPCSIPSMDSQVPEALGAEEDEMDRLLSAIHSPAMRDESLLNEILGKVNLDSVSSFFNVDLASIDYPNLQKETAKDISEALRIPSATHWRGMEESLRTKLI